MKFFFFTLILVGVLGYSDKVLYNIAYKNGELAADQKWRGELIKKNYAGYAEKSGEWEYLKEPDVLLRLLIKYNDKPAAPKGLKLEMNDSPINDKDYLVDNDRFSLAPLVKIDKKKK